MARTLRQALSDAGNSIASLSAEIIVLKHDRERLTAENEKLRAASQRLNDEVDMYWNGCRTDAQAKRINEAQQSLRAAFQQQAVNSEEGKESSKD